MNTLVADPKEKDRSARRPAHRQQTVCVQGLGFVGAANAIAIAKARDAGGTPLYRVIGVDLPSEQGRARAAALNAGRFPFATTDRDLEAAAQESLATGNLSAVTDNAIFAEADIIVVDVGLDLTEKGGDRPSFAVAPFRAALTAVGQNMRPEALILLESTVPPGTCERIAAPILRDALTSRGLSADGLKLAYCYERVMPGEAYLASITDMWRVYAGMTPEAADAAEAFLSNVIDVAKKPLRRLANIRSAEMAKVLENTYRAVNIALIDEWERFARRIGVDLFEVLEAIRVRPTHNNIRYPGLGVGGYCLTKDPLFGPASAREIFGIDDLTFPLSTLGVEINDAMPLATVSALASLLPGGLKKKKVLILGASYRQDVADMRQSPSSILAQGLLQEGAIIEFADPLVSDLEDVAAPLHRNLPLPEGYDAVILAVPHREFRSLDVLDWLGSARPVIFDSNGVLSGGALAALSRAGVTVGAIGRSVMS